MLDFSHHGYCGQNNSQYIVIFIDSIKGVVISQINFYFVYIVFLFFFYPTNIRVQTKKSSANSKIRLFLIITLY